MFNTDRKCLRCEILMWLSIALVSSAQARAAYAEWSDPHQVVAWTVSLRLVLHSGLTALAVVMEVVIVGRLLRQRLMT